MKKLSRNIYSEGQQEEGEGYNDTEETKSFDGADTTSPASVFDEYEMRKLPNNANQQCSIVRELHVYGTAVPVHSKDPTKFQHQGYGMLLMEEAERIAREEHRSVKLLVISGVGTRHYYRKMGYELDGPYMSKLLI